MSPEFGGLMANRRGLFSALGIFSVIFILLFSGICFASEATSLSASFNGSGQDKAGMWNIFGPGVGSAGNSADWQWSALLSIPSQKTIKSMSMRHNGYNEGWSTASVEIYGKKPYPLVVFYNNSQVNNAYDHGLGSYAAGSHVFKLYGQIETTSFKGAFFEIVFTDGTSISVSILAGQRPEETIPPVAPTNPANTSPAISGIPDITISRNSATQYKLIDLWAYASDMESPDDKLNYSIASQTNSSLIKCYIDSGHYISCDAPSDLTGSNTITAMVSDDKGLSATDSFVITITGSGSGSNNGYNEPSISGLPDIRISENSGYRERLIDLWAYAYDSEDSDSEMRYYIDSQSNDSLVYCRIVDNHYFECESPREDSTGTSTITIEARDRSNRTDNDTFEVEVGNGYYGSDRYYGSRYCSSVYINTRAVYIDSGERERVSFEVRNASGSDFRINNVDIGENSPYLTVRDISYDNHIDAYGYGRIEFDIDAGDYGWDREETIDIDLSGEYTEGSRRYCNYSDVRTASFRVIINRGSGAGSNYSYGSCGEVSMSAFDITMPEQSRRTKTVAIYNNDNSRSFSIDTVTVYEANSYFNVSVDRKPSTIGPNSSAEISLFINADAVDSDKGGNVKVSVAGRYSNGVYCSTSTIYRDFRVNVQDNYSGSRPSYGTSAVDISIADTFIDIGEGESKESKATITNNTGSRQCISLGATGGKKAFEASVSKNEVCLNDGASETVSLTIKGKAKGSGSAELSASYSGTSKSKFISIEVSGNEAQASAIVVENPSESNNYALVLENTGGDLTNASILATGLPQGVEFEKVTKALWKKGEQVKLEGKMNNFEGKDTGLAQIKASEGSIQIVFEFEAKKPQDTGITGLIGLATTAGMAIGILVIICLAIIGIIAILGREK